MTAIPADDSYGHIIEHAPRVPSARREQLRRIRTELTMLGVGFACVAFAIGYGVSQLF